MNLKPKLDALVKEVLDKGKTIETFGDYDPKGGKGHVVSIIEHGGLCVVFEKNNGEEDHLLLPDVDDARSLFSDIREEIEEER